MKLSLGELAFLSQRQRSLRASVITVCFPVTLGPQLIYSNIRQSTSSYTLAVSALLYKRVRGKIPLLDRLVEVVTVTTIDRAER